MYMYIHVKTCYAVLLTKYQIDNSFDQKYLELQDITSIYLYMYTEPIHLNYFLNCIIFIEALPCAFQAVIKTIEYILYMQACTDEKCLSLCETFSTCTVHRD
jgi:hypothetical protein